MKSYVNSFFDPKGVTVRASINKRDLVSQRKVPCLMGMLRNDGGLGSGESYTPFLPLHFVLNISPCFPDENVAVLTWNPVETPSCLTGSTGSFGHTKCDFTVASDLVLMPCCSR